MTAILETPITLEWLKASGFVQAEGDGVLQRLAIGHKSPEVFPGNLCLEVTCQRSGGFFAGVASLTQKKYIGLRLVCWTWEIERLAEGLCGRSWGEIQEVKP